MTDVVDRLASQVRAHQHNKLQRTKRYSAIGLSRDESAGPAKQALQADSKLVANLSTILENRRPVQVQSGWQREVGFVPQAAFSEGAYKFRFKNGRELVIPETFEAIGTRVWDCAPSMARWSEKGDFVRGKRILELGAGTGLLGLACAALGATKVVLTDLQSIHKAMERSIVSTGFQQTCVARTLDWNDISAVRALGEEFGPFDMIVASDVLVFAVDASTTGESGLVRALRILAEPGKTEILMGCNKNREGFRTGFLTHPPHHLLDIKFVDKSEVDEAFHSEMIVLYRMYLKPGQSL